MYLLICMVSINAFSYMMYSAGIEGSSPQPGYNASQIEDATDAENIVGAWDWDIEFYDLVFAVKWFVGAFWGLIAGFPTLCLSFGVPAFIYGPLFMVWGIMWSIVIILGYIGGRDV